LYNFWRITLYFLVDIVAKREDCLKKTLKSLVVREVVLQKWQDGLS